MILLMRACCGDQATGPSGSSVGFFAMARLWRDERSQEELRDAMRTVIAPGAASKLIAQWKLNEGFGG